MLPSVSVFCPQWCEEVLSCDHDTLPKHVSPRNHGLSPLEPPLAQNVLPYPVDLAYPEPLSEFPPILLISKCFYVHGIFTSMSSHLSVFANFELIRPSSLLRSLSLNFIYNTVHIVLYSCNVSHTVNCYDKQLKKNTFMTQ